MSTDSLLIIKGSEVEALLHDSEREVMRLVGEAYEVHASGQSVLPHSLFLRLPPQDRNRIIALPAYLGSPFEVAGLKWIASFPKNIEKDLNRASAVMVLNSLETGRPEVILEGSVISLKRTAASAVLAADCLHRSQRSTIGLIGCGAVNFEILRFLSANGEQFERIFLFDKDMRNAERFRERCMNITGDGAVTIAQDLNTVLSNCPLVSLATTASRPHIHDLSACLHGSTLLNVSLRDLSAKAILMAENVVDDIDHVCREQTSVHLAEQLAGNRDFIRSTLADVLAGHRSARSHEESVLVFSPFGLGVLDLAVAKLVRDRAIEKGVGTMIDSFLPDFWRSANERETSRARATTMATDQSPKH